MDRLSNRMWARSRKIGKRRFVALFGSLHSVGSCLLFWWILGAFSIHPPTLVTSVVITVLIAWGPLWAQLFWEHMERAWDGTGRAGPGARR